MKKLFEIPVYSLSESKFAEKYDDYYSKFNNNDINELKGYMYPQGVWRYNQIIGYITISVDYKCKDIVFEVYKHIGRVGVLSKQKKYIQNLYATGLHFRYEGLTSKEVVLKIREMIQCLASKTFSCF